MKIIVLVTTIVTTNSIVRSQNVSSISEGANIFNSEYYKALIEESTIYDKVAVAVLPIYALLSLLRHGSEGELEKTLTKYVHLPPNNTKTGHEFQDILTELTTDEQLQISNAVFINHDLEFKPLFMKTSLVSYKTALVTVNFTDLQDAAQFINDVHSTRTEGNVEDVIDPSDLDEDTKVIFGSAAYYQLYFRYAFKRKNTKKKRFYEDKHHSTLMSFMEIKGMVFNYSKSDQDLISSVLEVPLANPSLVAVFIMPILRSLGVEHTDDLIASDPKLIHRVIYNLREEKLLISIPKFKVEYGNSKLIAKELSSNYTFIQGNPGNFSLMLNYKSVIMVNDEDGIQESEEGDEFTHRFRLNRPFIFLIYSKQHNITIFRTTFYSPYNKIYRQECDIL